MDTLSFYILQHVEITSIENERSLNPVSGAQVFLPFLKQYLRFLPFLLTLFNKYKHDSSILVFCEQLKLLAQLR